MSLTHHTSKKTETSKNMQQKENPELINLLQPFVTERRFARMQEVLSQRTRHITVVVEDIYQSQNASAVLRSCECFGVQDVHIIENLNKYEINPDVALGANKWLNLYKYDQLEHNTNACLSILKENGYKIIATTPHKDDCFLEELPVDDKIALLFGTEMKGLSKEAIRMADGFIKIPMSGFTESFNISVSAAICLYHLVPKIKQTVKNWQLTHKEQSGLLLNWLKMTVNNADGIIDYHNQK